MKSVPALYATIRHSKGWPLVLFGGVALAVACQSNDGGIDREADNDDESVTSSTSTGGSGGSGGSQTGGAGEAGADTSGDGENSTSSSNGSDTNGSGGSSAQTSGGGSGGSGGTSGGTSTNGGGSGGTGGNVNVDDCTFHTDPAEEGAGGEGGAGAVDVQIAQNNFIGYHLVDGGLRALYIYGADHPGDCANPPVSNCVDDCLLSWPLFDAGARRLGEGLPDEAFGSFLRDDGLEQTTYMGWPLYYYKNDVAEGDLVGHGKGSTWLGAEIELPNVLVMRASEEDGGIKYLATGSGHTLYAFAGDTLGTPDEPPQSACDGACLNDYQPFVVNSLHPSSPIDPGDITVFVREDSGELQVAYKGAPLYTTDLDARSGQLQGAATTDWSVAEL